jgi:hypothetical protein
MVSKGGASDYPSIEDGASNPVIAPPGSQGRCETAGRQRHDQGAGPGALVEAVIQNRKVASLADLAAA